MWSVLLLLTQMEADWNKFLQRPEWVLICNTKLRLMTDTASNATSSSLFPLAFLFSKCRPCRIRGLERRFVHTGINYEWLCQEDERWPWDWRRVKADTVGQLECLKNTPDEPTLKGFFSLSLLCEYNFKHQRETQTNIQVNQSPFQLSSPSSILQE